MMLENSNRRALSEPKKSCPEPVHMDKFGDEILKVKGIKKHFQVSNSVMGLFKKQFVKAVDGVSLTVRKNEILGLVGESGCGKSTLGKLILQLDEATQGSVEFDNMPLEGLSQRALVSIRKKMQVIFQDPYSSLNPRMKVRDILSEPYLIHKQGSKEEIELKVAKLCSEVGLPEDALDKYPHQFSGGQRQRIGIARAIALSPEVIIADEPVSALDVSIQAQILNLLSDLVEKYKMSFVFITHDLAVLDHFCDTVAVMYLGRIVEYSTKEELFEQPKHPYTQVLLDAVPKTSSAFKKDKNSLRVGGTVDVPSPIDPPSGCYFHPRCSKATAVCKTTYPNLQKVGKGSWVACHHPASKA